MFDVHYTTPSLTATTEVCMSNWFLHTGNEDVQEVQNVVTKKDEKQEKGGSTREVQDLPFLNHDQPASSSSADEH